MLFVTRLTLTEVILFDQMHLQEIYEKKNFDDTEQCSFSWFLDL